MGTKEFIEIHSSYVTVREATKQGFAIAYKGDSINMEQPNSKTRRGRVGKQVAQTITTSPQQGVVETIQFTRKGAVKIIDSANTLTANDPSRTLGNNNPIVGVVTSRVMGERYNDDGQIERNMEVSDREYPNAIATAQKDSMTATNLRIRKLTPLECWRLMGFNDEDFYKAEQVNSNTQLYKQAGNSIVVNVLEAILVEILEAVFNAKEVVC